MGDVINFEAARARALAKRDKTQVDYVCYACGNTWAGTPPKGMEKRRCPKCRDTLIRYKPR